MTLQRLPDGTQNPSWVKERQGMVGGSQMKHIFRDCEWNAIPEAKRGKTKDAPSLDRLTLAKKLAAERLTGHSVDNVNPNNPDIKRGNEMEPIALAEYEVKFGEFLMPARWVAHPEIPGSGSTPDSFRSDGGLVQVKAPRFDNYLSHVSGGVIPVEYVTQLIWEQAVTRAPHTDFVCYCAEMPAGKQMWVKRFEATAEQIEAMESVVKEFVAEVEFIFDTISKMEFA
jgi:hypothetical protein